MRTARSAAVVTLLLALGAWAGGDPWKDKNYQQWDAKECQKIMWDSPWAQIVLVDAPWQPLSPGSGLPATRDGANRSMGGPGGSGSQGMGPGGSDMGGSDQTPTAKFLVRWGSSRIEREAGVRSAILEARIKDSDADKLLSVAPEDYQLLVYGPDMTPFNGAEEKTLQESAYLSPKKSKEKISPTKVQIQRDSGGQKVTAVVFSFPKKLASGEASIGMEERNIEFICTAGKLKLKSNFDLQKMTDKQGRDL